MKTFIAFILLLFALNISAQEDTFKKIDSIVHSKLQEDHPGIAVGIIKEGEIIYEKYRGLANLQHQIPFDEKTRSNIASTAKQFTALMILQLSFYEKLNLEDDIRKYLPNLYPDVKEEIKIRHLLNHTSGIRDYVELVDLDGLVWWQRFGLDNDDVLELLEKQKDLGFAPGSVYSYSNSNYNLLAEIIERVTEQSFNEYSKKFFQDLGMPETSFVERYMRVIPNRANPYSDWGRGEWWEVPTVTKTKGEGFLFTTLKDQLHFELAVQNAKKNNNVLLIKSQEPIPNSEIKKYGFGLELEDRLGRTSVHHSGGTYGFHSQTYRFPEDELTIFIMSNNGNISSNLIAKEIGEILLDPKKKKKDQYDERFYAKNDGDVKILGQYDDPDKDMIVRIVEKDGKVFWREGNYWNLEMPLTGKNTYTFKVNTSIVVKFYEDEMIEYYASGKTIVHKRMNTKEATSADIEGLVGTYHNDELNVSYDLTLSADKKLQFKFSDSNELGDVQVFNRENLLADGNAITVKRDVFNRVTHVLLSYGRARNMKFTKKTNLKYQPKIPTENGSIQVTTIGSINGDRSDILLTKNYPNGNEIWFKKFGGKSYDKASSILDTGDGYLIVGSTSSYGKGNYDMLVIKTDKEGKQLWQKTYGQFYNKYGYSAEKTEKGYLIKGTIQDCPNNTDINRKCRTNVWFVQVDKNGKELFNKILEEVVYRK